MDRLVPGSVIFICLLLLGVGVTVGVSSAASTGSAVSDDDGVTANATNVTDVDPIFENVTVPVEDAEPFEFGTTLVIQEATLMSMTLQADESEVAGNVSVRESQSTALGSLAESRTVHSAIDVTVPEAATDVPATLRLVTLAYPIENRENLEVLRYTDGDWEPLETTVASDRIWSSDRGASVLLVEAETPGFSTFAVTETESESTDTVETHEDGEPLTETETDAVDDSVFAPHPEADVYRISDRRPFEFGTHVHIHEKTVREITFQAPRKQIAGYVAINDSRSPAVDRLHDERSVVRTFNITATRNASQTPAMLHLAVRALDVDDRDDLEVLRYDEEAGSWEALRTAVVSERYWSSDHEASVFDVEAETPSFSMFAVTEQPDEPEPDDQTDDAESDLDTDADPEPVDSDDGGLLFGLGLLEVAVALIVLGGGGAAVFVVRRR